MELDSFLWLTAVQVEQGAPICLEVLTSLQNTLGEELTDKLESSYCRLKFWLGSVIVSVGLIDTYYTAIEFH